MKRLISAVMVALILLALIGCGEDLEQVEEVVISPRISISDARDYVQNKGREAIDAVDNFLDGGTTATTAHTIILSLIDDIEPYKSYSADNLVSIYMIRLVTMITLYIQDNERPEHFRNQILDIRNQFAQGLGVQRRR